MHSNDNVSYQTTILAYSFFTTLVYTIFTYTTPNDMNLKNYSQFSQAS